MTDSETRGWKRDTAGNYFKAIGDATYWIFRDTYWFVREGYAHGSGYVGEWAFLTDAKRAAHKHAREKANE